MVGVAAALGVALGAALGLLVRRERAIQLAATGLLALALAVALLLAGAPLPALGMLLLGGVTPLVFLMPAVGAAAARPAGPRPWAAVVAAGAAALGAGGVILGAGIASRGDLIRGGASPPGLAAVGQHLVMGTGVPLLALLILAATTVVAGAALIQRDPREAAEEQLELARARRQEAHRLRQEQREAARAAARATRRGTGR